MFQRACEWFDAHTSDVWFFLVLGVITFALILTHGKATDER